MKIKLFLFILFFVLASMIIAFANSPSAETGAEQSEVMTSGVSSQAIKYLAASISVGAAAAFSGIAIGRIGSAAMGAISEKPEAGGTAIILAALAEGVCLWGIAGAALIIFF